MGKKKNKKPKAAATPPPPPAPFTPSYTNQFQKDLAHMIARGKDRDKIREVMDRLINRRPLEVRHSDHPLKGTWVGRRDCHVEGDWVLIYKRDDKANEITFERTGIGICLSLRGPLL
ncbi:MAG: type II toxin-antitoxin system YafQ family toxin [Deltaproteobacteria bacterium]|nr:type II toxin-antitoxin system YafQ family toxin [Deltaproteobacteria bacterium]